MTRALLILGCSQAKRYDGAMLPAIERYDGPTWRVLRRALADRPGLADRLIVLALSAEFGLIPAGEAIPAYNRRMDAARAEALRIPVARALDRLAGRPIASAFVNVGAVYRHALPGPLLWPTTWAAGGIGERLHQLKAWLHQIGGAP